MGSLRSRDESITAGDDGRAVGPAVDMMELGCFGSQEDQTRSSRMEYMCVQSSIEGVYEPSKKHWSFAARWSGVLTEKRGNNTNGRELSEMLLLIAYDYSLSCDSGAQWPGGYGRDRGFIDAVTARAGRSPTSWPPACARAGGIARREHGAQVRAQAYPFTPAAPTHQSVKCAGEDEGSRCVSTSVALMEPKSRPVDRIPDESQLMCWDKRLGTILPGAARIVE